MQLRKAFIIHHLDATPEEESYKVNSLSECRDEVDKSAMAEAVRSGEVITMGKVVVEPIMERVPEERVPDNITLSDVLRWAEEVNQADKDTMAPPFHAEIASAILEAKQDFEARVDVSGPAEFWK